MADLGEALDFFDFAVCFFPRVHRLPIEDPIDDFANFLLLGVYTL